MPPRHLMAEKENAPISATEEKPSSQECNWRKLLHLYILHMMIKMTVFSTYAGHVTDLHKIENVPCGLVLFGTCRTWPGKCLVWTNFMQDTMSHDSQNLLENTRTDSCFVHSLFILTAFVVWSTVFMIYILQNYFQLLLFIFKCISARLRRICTFFSITILQYMS